MLFVHRAVRNRGRRRLRWALSIVAFTVVAFALIAVAVPLAVSTDLVRQRLKHDIGAWAGQRVTLGNNPKLTFWPIPTITFDNVALYPRRPHAKPIAVASSVEGEFSVLSALTGKPHFTRLLFRSPIFTVERGATGLVNWRSDFGRIAEAARIARARANGNKKAGSVPDYSLGTIAISGGTIRYIDHRDDDIETITDLSGTIDWPETLGNASMDLRGMFRGKKVHLAASSSQPLLLIGGANARLKASFDASPIGLAFNGTTTLAERPFFDGRMTLDTPSVEKILQWFGADIKPGAAIGRLNVDAHVTTQSDRVNFDDLTLKVGGNRGIGVLDVNLPKPRFPVIAGTIAFNSLDIVSFLRAFSPLPKPGQNIATTVDTRFLRQLGLDLRLSAQSAKLGPMMLDDVAATARISEGRASFEIGDASAYGGSLNGEVRISEKGLDGGGMVRAAADNVDLGAMYDAMKLSGPLPRGRGSLRLELQSDHPLWATGISDITGQMKLSVGNGTIPKLDLAAFRALAAKERFFDLSKISGDALDFASAKLDCRFSDGMAEINDATITTNDTVIRLNGVVPYARGSLAMTGSLEPKPAPKKGAAKPDDTDDGLRFFVGGSWPSPVISPVVTR
ncbi:AsmA family protein [Pararhizobium mangrovi]|nr:AsmA-like C-terminal region-containing protein [Pararhizobium mangrovi]